MNANLQKAIDTLRIHDVYLRLMLPTMQLAHHRHNELHDATAEETNQI